MKTVWTEHLKEPEDKQRFENYVVHSKELLDRLKDIVHKQLMALDNSEMTLEAYDKANWDYRQAHKNGYRSCAHKLLQLLEIQTNGENNG